MSSISAEDATVDEIDWEKVAHILHGKRRTSLVQRSPMDCCLAWTNEFGPHITQKKWGKEEVVFFIFVVVLIQLPLLTTAAAVAVAAAADPPPPVHFIANTECPSPYVTINVLLDLSLRRGS